MKPNKQKIFMRWLTICLLWTLVTFDGFTNGQIVRSEDVNEQKTQQLQQQQQQRKEEEIESMHKYQQLQYQIQQQQQLQYQQQMQQQQQYHYLQQQQRQQEQQPPSSVLQPISLALQKKLHEPHSEGVGGGRGGGDTFASPTAQIQMLKTGASLIVAAETGPAELGEKEYYPNIDAKQIATRRSSTVNGRKRKRRPQQAVGGESEGDASNGENDSKQYWRGHVDDDTLNTAGNAKGDSNVHLKAQRRRKQPAIREPLAALEKEQKLYELRDRQRQEHGEVAIGPKGRDKSYRRPYSQAKKENESTTQTSTTIATAIAAGTKTANDLKHLLKNSGGLSLSEILQQKNLSLDDLLKGKENALLALQTTAATVQRTDNFKHLKPARRIPATFLGGAITEVDANSSERGSSEEGAVGKNKLKFPALQRLKLFGTSSRTTAIPLPGNGEGARKREPSTGTTSSTTSTTTTTRLPIYKKRAQQRPTLRPLARFKVTTGATLEDVSNIKEATTPKEISTTTTKSTEESDQVELRTELSESHDDLEASFNDHEEDMEEELSENYEATTLNFADITTTPTEMLSISTTATPSTTTTATTTKKATLSTSTTKTSTTITANNSSSRRHKLGAQSRQRIKSKIRERVNDNNLKSNSIELHDTEHKEATNRSSSKESAENPNSSNEDDDLENFFEEVSKEAKREAEEMEMTAEEMDRAAESITARIDRAQNKKAAGSPLPSFASTTIADSSEVSLPDFDGIDDRTDLLELIEDRRSGNRLFKVLQQRNMTLDELIEHRKRGSSQLHLATIVEQNARSKFFPGQKVVLHDNMDIVTAFENFPHFNLLNLKSVKPDDIKTDSQGSSYFTSIIDIEPTDEAYKGVGVNGIVAGGDGSLRGPMYSQSQSQRTDKSLSFFPSWKTLALASLTSTTKGNPFFLPAPKLLLDDRNSNELNEENFMISNETSGSSEQQEQQQQPQSAKISNIEGDINAAENTAEAIENEVARAHDLLDLELSGHAFKRSPAAASMIKQQYNGAGSLYANMPAGIRSAIVASAAIVLTSLATFLVIFIVCRLKQRKRSNTNFLRSYSSIKSKTTNAETADLAAATTTITTTTLGKMSVAAAAAATATMATNSRRSSLRNSNIESIMTNSGVGGANSVGGQHVSVSTISATANQQQQQLPHRSSDLLFPRRESLVSGAFKTGQKHHNVKTCTKGLLCGRSGSSRSSCRSDFSPNNGGFSSITGSTSSLALSLRSAHNVSSTKLNTMDPNSPEVQEYLFDTLRKSFN